jgi:hypothetical protein
MPDAERQDGTPSVFERHPRFTLLAVLLVLLLVVFAMAEVALRVMGSLDVSYYTGHSDAGIHRYPYGEIPVNSSGYPDNEEFAASDDRDRIAYVGDSVTYGVGAGFPYRIPDLIEAQVPVHHHWVFGGLGEHLEGGELLSQVRKYRLDRIVYLMNLNDILPIPVAASDPAATSASRPSWIVRLRESAVGDIDSSLRGKSYLYTYLRVAIKNWLQRMGFEASGYEAFELYPTRNAVLVSYATRSIADALDLVRRETGTTGCVVILPYEMQVSRQAATTYRELGFEWEAGFEEGSTQQALMAGFSSLGVRAFDAREAFAGLDPAVGETFVYNRGDKTDWNHPNREGHSLIARWLLANPAFRTECLGLGS